MASLATSLTARPCKVARLGAQARGQRIVARADPLNNPRSTATKTTATGNKPGTPTTGSTTEYEFDGDQMLKDIQAKWDSIEDKTSVGVYAAGSVALVWLSASLVQAINGVPLLPKLMELVGLGYTTWFVYRYLLFKESREELISDIDELKKKISGEKA